MSDWNEFLGNQSDNFHAVSAEFNQDVTYLMPLNQGIIAITGPDSTKFLQGQVTCDVRELASPKTLLGAQCNIKGRMLLCFRALQPTPEQILLRVHPGLVVNGLASLGKYIVFSKAKLSDESQHYRSIGVAGPAAAKVIKTVFDVVIDEDNGWQKSGENLIIRIDEHRYECWLAAATAAQSFIQLCTHTTAASQEFWRLLDIRAGLGDITPETYETFTPQAINFQLVNGINFRKGCYTGQEIVARLHYRGTLKRHMYHFACELGDRALPLPGSALKNSEGKNVGELVLSAHSGPGRAELLASVTDDERADIFVENNPQKLSLLTLPYAIPTANEGD